MRNNEQENILTETKRNYNSKLELLEEEKRQLNLRVMNLSKEQIDNEIKLKKKQYLIMALQARSYVLECELNKLQAKYQELTDSSRKQISELTDKYEKEIEYLRSNFSKEKEELVTEIKMYQTRESETKEKANKMEETNSCLSRELKDIQKLFKDVRILVCHTFSSDR